MTSIACDRLGMAGDTQVTGGTERGFIPTKVFRIRGWLVGYAGTVANAEEFMREMRESGRAPLAYLREFELDEAAEDVQLLLLSPAGHIWHWQGKDPFRDARPYAAIGSGSSYALAALHLGHEHKAAIAVAAHFDTASGGLTTYHTLRKT